MHAFRREPRRKAMTVDPNWLLSEPRNAKSRANVVSAFLSYYGMARHVHDGFSATGLFGGSVPTCRPEARG